MAKPMILDDVVETLHYYYDVHDRIQLIDQLTRQILKEDREAAVILLQKVTERIRGSNKNLNTDEILGTTQKELLLRVLKGEL